MSLSRTLIASAISGLLGYAVFSLVPAHAGDFHVRFGGHHSGFGIYLGDGGYSYDDDGFRWREKRCTTDRALFKARRLGVRHARIDYANHNEIGVVGRSHGERVYLTFSRARHCPVIG
jgi:hypothetical protein